MTDGWTPAFAEGDGCDGDLSNVITILGLLLDIPDKNYTTRRENPIFVGYLNADRFAFLYRYGRMGMSPGEKALFAFFFQAEDGIRDTSVTGVQTCALPIFTGRESCAFRR